MKTKTAIIFGSSGLVGNYLLKELLNDKRYSQITIFVRKPVNIKHMKVKELVVDLYDAQKISELLDGDEVYCCLGTTIKIAGTQEAFRKVDFDLPIMIGTLVKQKGISKLLVVSSLGANPDSNNFYLRTKGEMEQALLNLNIPELKIFRPSMLLGDRKEVRTAEATGKFLMKYLSFAFIGSLRKYKAIHASTVASCMIKAANSDSSKSIYESDELQTYLQ